MFKCVYVQTTLICLTASSSLEIERILSPHAPKQRLPLARRLTRQLTICCIFVEEKTHPRRLHLPLWTWRRRSQQGKFQWSRWRWSTQTEPSPRSESGEHRRGIINTVQAARQVEQWIRSDTVHYFNLFEDVKHRHTGLGLILHQIHHRPLLCRIFWETNKQTILCHDNSRMTPADLH